MKKPTDKLINNLNIKGATNSGKGESSGWSGVAEDDTFFTKYILDPKRWDRIFPYRLLVIDVSEGNSVVIGDGEGVDYDFTTSSSPMHSGISFSLTSTNESKWAFTLPITPQQLSIQDLYAINGTATARGVAEEHNGVKFKMITAQGTMGVRPTRTTLAAEGGSGGLFGSIFSGTLGAVSNIGSTIKGFKDAVNGAEDESGLSKKELKETGYYQAMLMGQFLERYAEAKKNPKNKHWRLCFDIPKQSKSFIVIPEVFSLKQNYMRPNQMLWDIKLRAYARVTLNISAIIKPIGLFVINDFQKMSNVIGQTRKLISQSLDLIKAVKSDVAAVFNALRQIALFIKDVAGFIVTLADLPNSILESIKESITGTIAILNDAIGLFSKKNTTTFLTTNNQDEKTSAIKGMMFEKNNQSEDGNVKLSNDATDPLNDVTKNPEKYFGFYNSINVGDIDKSPEQERAIKDVQDQVKFINIDTINTHKATILDLHTAISNNMGMGDSTYSNAYGKPTSKVTTTQPNLDDLELLQSLMEAIQVMDDLTATKLFDNNKKTDSLEFVSNLANNAGIDFFLPQGKNLVPVPFGMTMEEISARYLKDANRWIEIATVNNLRSPYIDEEGFIYSLLSNGEGRQFSADDSNGRLFVGQKITLRSSTVPKFVRTITEIEKIGDGNFLITVDGNADLGKLKAVDGASMQAYLPGTTNSQNRIYIPSQTKPDAEDNVKKIPNLETTQINKLAKVDWLLDDKGDVAINSIGEVMLSTGMTNLIQAAKMKINTRKGTILSHLNYGMSKSVGASLADIDNGKTAAEINKLFAADPRFDGLDRADVILEKGILSINLVIKITGGNGVVPIGFNIK